MTGSVVGAGPDPAGGGPLAGRTVVVTRAGRRAAGLVDALERAGARALELPLTRQVDPADGGAALQAAADDVQAYRSLVLTSANAVDRFMACLRDPRTLAGVLVAVVGPATAEAFRKNGVEPDLVPAEHSARGLVESFPDAPTAGAPALFPCAEGAPDTVSEGLGLKGWTVRRVAAYRTVAEAAPAPEQLAHLSAADALTFTAPSSVEAFVALRASDGTSVRAPAHVVCIGPTTTAAARQAGLAGVHEAWGASAEGIVAELIDHFGPGARGAP